jgi:broad specificity phosphatase PhoE
MQKSEGLTIIFFAHGSSIDNENGLASGWYDVRLSEIGEAQAFELHTLTEGLGFDAVYCSDLRRAYETAEIAFGSRKGLSIIRDRRLRECDYGDLTQKSVSDIEFEMPGRIMVPFPHGESMLDVERRVGDLVSDLRRMQSMRNVAVVSHQAPQLALDVILSGKTWPEAIAEDWRKSKPARWRPGWQYVVKV